MKSSRVGSAAGRHRPQRRHLHTSANSTVDLSNQTQGVDQVLISTQARDQVISDLHNRILSLESELKYSEGQSFISLQRNLEDALKSNVKLIDEIKSLENRCEILENELKSVQETGKIDENRAILHDLESKNASLSEVIASKDTEISSLKRDIESLSAILTQMNQMNHDLNEKISVIQTKSIELSKKEYEMSLRLGHLEELEAELAQLRLKNTNFTQIYEILNNSIVEPEIRIENALKSINLSEKRGNLKENIDEIGNLKMEIRKLEIICELQKNRLQNLENENEKIGNEEKNARELFFSKNIELQETIKTQKNHEKEWENIKNSLKIDLKRLEMQLKSEISLKNSFKARFEFLSKEYNSLKCSFKQHKIANLSAKSALLKQSLTTRSRNREVLLSQTRTRVLSDELWRKEMEVLGKEREKLKLRTELETLKIALKRG